MLLSGGAAIDAVDNTGKTALIWAANFGRDEVAEVRSLLQIVFLNNSFLFHVLLYAL